MSVSAFFNGGIETPLPIRLTTTSLTDIFTATDRSSTIASWSLANETGGGVLADCYYYDGTTNFLVFSRSVGANDTVIVTDIPLRLRDGNKFKVQAATGNAITVTPIVSRSHYNEPAK